MRPKKHECKLLSPSSLLQIKTNQSRDPMTTLSTGMSRLQESAQKPPRQRPVRSNSESKHDGRNQEDDGADIREDSTAIPGWRLTLFATARYG